MSKSLLSKAGRRLPARVGAMVVILHGEGYSPRRGGPRPRNECRFLAGEFGTIFKSEVWFTERRYGIKLPPHPDYPTDGEREYWLPREDFVVVPAGTTPNTSAMDNHPTTDKEQQ